MKNNFSLGFYSTCTSLFWLQNLGKLDSFHALLTANGKLMAQYCPCVDMKKKYYFAFESLTICGINMPRTKTTEGTKWRIIAIKDAGMKKLTLQGR